MADAWKAEEARQAQELADILNREIMAYGDRLAAEGKQALLNAVAGAIVTITAVTLASVEDRRVRKKLRVMMDRKLPAAIAAHDGRVGRSQVVVVGRRTDA